MKVVLRQEVDNLGRRGDVVNVARGYARNYLLPKGLALEATPGNLKTIELKRKAWEVHEQRELTAAQALAARIADTPVRVTKKAGETETLYGSVTAAEIADLLRDRGIEIDRRKLRLDEPIKSLGHFEVPLRLHHEVTAKVILEVAPETSPESEAPGEGPAADSADE